MKAREWWNFELKKIVYSSLSDGVRPISDRVKLVVGYNEALLLLMYPKIFAHVELVWQSMLIMMLLVLNIGSVHYVMDLPSYVLNALIEVFFLVSFELDMT